MKARTFYAAAGTLAIASGAAAQQTATYSFVFTSPSATAGNGTANITVNPNSVVSATVLVSFNPGIGQPGTGPGTLTGTILGLSAGNFSIAGTGNAGPGWSNLYLVQPYNIPFGPPPGNVAGSGQSVSGVIWGLAFLLQTPHPSPENPDQVWGGTYTTGAAGVVNLSFTGLGTTTVYMQGASFIFEGNFRVERRSRGQHHRHPGPRRPCADRSRRAPGVKSPTLIAGRPPRNVEQVARTASDDYEA